MAEEIATQMRKLNTMGKVQGQNAPNNNPKQIVNVTYGHNGSGKLYSYYGQNKRTGDIVTPEVTHPKSGKKYKTLAVVKSTHNIQQGQNTVNYLANKQVEMKTLEKTDQKSLPGYYPGWDKDAAARKDLQYETQLRDDISPMQKLSLMRETRKM